MTTVVCVLVGSGHAGTGVYALRDLGEWELVGVDRAAACCKYDGSNGENALAERILLIHPIDPMGWLRSLHFTQSVPANYAKLRAAATGDIPPELRPIADCIGLYQYNWRQRHADGEQTNQTGIFPTLCLLNHSCDPNCAISLDSSESGLVALRRIGKGEELTVSYQRFLTAHPVLRRVMAPLNKIMFGGPCLCSSKFCIGTADLFGSDIKGLDAAESRSVYNAIKKGAGPRFEAAVKSGNTKEIETSGSFLAAMIIVLAQKINIEYDLTEIKKGWAKEAPLIRKTIESLVNGGANGGASPLLLSSPSVRWELALLHHLLAFGAIDAPPLYAGLPQQIADRFAAVA